MGSFGQRPGQRWRASRVIRGAIIVVIACLLLPYILTLLYRFVNPVSTPMLWRWMTGNRVERSYVPLAQMAPALPLTVLIAEDARFCRHAGVDFQGLRDIVEVADDARQLRGGSTITQQTAKNLFLWQRRSIVRKALEFPLALWMDLVLPKRRVLEIYLNIAEWGPKGEFGVEAASRQAFGKSARDLTTREAALLAAVLPNPTRRNAQNPGPNVLRLAGIYEARAAAAAAVGDCLRMRTTP
jgi:monofunctional biosynthetic peptidoglycan transglycosylase